MIYLDQDLFIRLYQDFQVLPMSLFIHAYYLGQLGEQMILYMEQLNLRFQKCLNVNTLPHRVDELKIYPNRHYVKSTNAFIAKMSKSF